MRLHHLTIQAFGPFGGTVDVDFDELNTAGQFLISGATGSGKTSILDAVCFALYGEVPGERQRAKHLRSDHAAAGAEPRVTLTLTVAERLIRISRSPAWERPKRRGEGLTLQQASVRLEQKVDGDWLCLATRLDEAGHLINTWLGMTPVQFTQVALLPQGGFQTFLQSPTAARQAVLQRLFRTDRFERVERWFGDLRRSLNRTRSEALHAIDVIAHRLAEAAGEPEPPGTEGGVDMLDAWARTQCSRAEAADRSAEIARDEAAIAHADARRALDDATALAAALDRAETAQRQLDEMTTTAPDFEQELRALRAHERARSLAPLIQASAEAAAMSDAATRLAADTLHQLGLSSDDHDRLEELMAQVRADVQRSDHALALNTRLQAAREDEMAAQELWHTTATRLDEVRAAAEAIPEQRARLAEDLDLALAAQVDLAAAALELELTQQGCNAARELAQLTQDLDQRADQRRLLYDRVQNLRQDYQDAREARIEAMASELAGALVVGCSCPVCGGTSHPSPATTSGSVGRRAEERARKKYESAGVELAALDDVIAAARARSESLIATTRGIGLGEWEQKVHALEAREAELTEAAAAVEPLRARATALDEQLTQAQREVDGLVQAEAQEQARLAMLRAQIRELTGDLEAALGDHPDVATFAAQARARLDLLTAALVADRKRLEASAAADQQLASLDLQARSLGFASGRAADDALLSDERAEQIADRERHRAQARLAALAVLDDPLVIESLRLPRPDLAPVTQEAARTEDALASARARLQMTTNRLVRTKAIALELETALKAYRPLEAKAERVNALSGLLEGTGADNRLRMRLSAFVLAERLRQVVDAANARLEVISAGRYVLAYQEERGAGDNRGGLSLSVLDEWTGVRRDPSTLSGGETFVVSLCLALGLADTVADESGGLRIDTLFIDEGFGSLDAQTLDSVIDILSQLSQGGRVTGVVSHVFELRERLPAVLEVVPSKTGSTVRRASA